MKHIFHIAVASLLAAGAVAQERYTREDYIEKYKDWAVEEMQRVGIPASITIAQGILESDCGNSYLAVDGNNHFGIKCHNWAGETIHHDDDRNQECFRKYDSAFQSFKDHSDFLSGNTRYASLFTLDKTDYKGWAKGLRAAGYATDPSYPEKLIKIIEETGIGALDEQVVAGTYSPTPTRPQIKEEATVEIATSEETKKTPKIRLDADYVINPLHQHEVKYNNGVRYIEVQGGDTFENIALEFHLLLSELLHYNDLTPQTADISTMKYVYVRSKRNRAHPECQTHTVRQNETAWDIAHSYGIKLRKLNRLNHLAPSQRLEVGSTLRLR